MLPEESGADVGRERVGSAVLRARGGRRGTHQTVARPHLRSRVVFLVAWNANVRRLVGGDRGRRLPGLTATDAPASSSASAWSCSATTGCSTSSRAPDLPVLFDGSRRVGLGLEYSGDGRRDDSLPAGVDRGAQGARRRDGRRPHYPAPGEVVTRRGRVERLGRRAGRGQGVEAGYRRNGRCRGRKEAARAVSRRAGGSSWCGP